MNDALWYFGRAAGFTSLILFTIVVVLGIVVRAGRPLPGLPRFAVSAVHRTASLTALGMLVVHVVTLMFDSYAQLNFFDAFVPFIAVRTPLWTGLGTLSADLIIVLIVSALLRHRIGQRTFRLLHWLAYACWPIAIVHSIGNGTDGTSWWILSTAGTCVATVGIALWWRLVKHPGEFGRPDVASKALTRSRA